jgi:hypothetical protein
LDEEWVVLLDFPIYEISSLGSIRNRNTGKLVSTSLTKQNVVKAYLVRDGKQYTRALGVLVATVFVHGYNDLFNTVTHLNGDLSDCSAMNLAWRPRWFAYQYHRQFHNPEQHDVCFGNLGLYGPIYELNTNVCYPTIADACVTNGLLIREVFARINDNYNDGVYPGGYRFSFDPYKTKAEMIREEYEESLKEDWSAFRGRR